MPTEQSTIGISPADAWVRDGMSRAEADVLATEIIAGAEAVATSPGIRTALQFDPAITAGRSDGGRHIHEVVSQITQPFSSAPEPVQTSADDWKGRLGAR